MTPNSQIYFYKFTSPGAPNDPLFTTRFTIADAQGATVTPTQTETASTGDLVAWGTGALTDPSQGDQPPNLGNTTDTGSSTAAPSGSATNGPGSGNTGSSTRTGHATTTAATSSETGAGAKTLPSMALGVVGAFAAMFFL